MHAIHKANIQYVRIMRALLRIHSLTCSFNRKMSDGLFLESVREVAKKYPDIEFREMIIDNTCMQVLLLPLDLPSHFFHTFSLSL